MDIITSKVTLLFFLLISVPTLSLGEMKNADGEISTDPWSDFKYGESRLTCDWGCNRKDYLLRTEMMGAHEDQRWEDLAKLVIRSSYRLNRNYFYLGIAAEKLGYLESALIYYRLAIAERARCRRKLCGGIEVKDESIVKIASIKKTLSEGGTGITNDEKTKSQTIEQQVINIDNSDFAPSTTTNSNWSLLVDADPITDEKVVNANLLPNDANSRRAASLNIRCESNKIDVIVNFNDYLGDSIFVTHRVDKEKPVRSRWNVSTNKRAGFYPSNTKRFLKKLMQANTFVVRAMPYNESEITLIFDIGGLYNELGQHSNACFSGVLTQNEIQNNDIQVNRKVESVVLNEQINNKNPNLFESSDTNKTPFSVPLSNIQSRINNDPSADGIKIAYSHSASSLYMDITDIEGDTSLASVVRVIFMTARLASNDYQTMIFRDQSNDIFNISGSVIQDIGQQFLWGEESGGQNPIHLMRLFIDNLRNADGSRVARKMTGSLLGDTNIAMRTFNDQFHPRWTLKTINAR